MKISTLFRSRSAQFCHFRPHLIPTAPKLPKCAVDLLACAMTMEALTELALGSIHSPHLIQLNAETLSPLAAYHHAIGIPKIYS
jgi:hypothetical protein